jgi:hypothetical protein
MVIIATTFWQIAKNSAACATERKVAETEIYAVTDIDEIDH